MKKLISAVLAAVILLALFGCKTSETYIVSKENQEETVMNGVFRYANWDDSLETVAGKEKEKCIVKADDAIAYDDVSLMTYNTKVAYFFEDGGFVSGFYEIKDAHTNDELYIDDFHNIDKALEEKYGEPIKQDEEWSNRILSDTPGLALFMGDVEYVSIWQNDNVKIMHKLSADNHEIEHIIFYNNPHKEVVRDTTGL